MYKDQHAKKDKKEKSNKMQRQPTTFLPLEHGQTSGMPVGVTVPHLRPLGHSGPDIQEESDQRCNSAGDTSDDQQR